MTTAAAECFNITCAMAVTTVCATDSHTCVLAACSQQCYVLDQETQSPSSQLDCILLCLLSLTYSIYSCTVTGGVTLDGTEVYRALVGQAVWLHLTILTFYNVTASQGDEQL